MKRELRSAYVRMCTYVVVGWLVGFAKLARGLLGLAQTSVR